MKKKKKEEDEQSVSFRNRHYGGCRTPRGSQKHFAYKPKQNDDISFRSTSALTTDGIATAYVTSGFDIREAGIKKIVYDRVQN